MKLSCEAKPSLEASDEAQAREQAPFSCVLLRRAQMLGVHFAALTPATDIIDGNLKLILGLIWTLILRFTIADISAEGLSAREGLLLWCQRKTAPYSDVSVVDFTHSWKSGRALCALIHRHRPDLLDYDALPASPHECTALAFSVAQEHLGIPQLLDVEDLCDAKKPDERSVMTYVAQYFHAFSTMEQAEVVSRRVATFADVMQGAWVMQVDYERRAREVSAWHAPQSCRL
jgi:hypothetical protein